MGLSLFWDVLIFLLFLVVFVCLGLFRVVQLVSGCFILFMLGCFSGCVGQFRLCRILLVGLVSKV